MSTIEFKFGDRVVHPARPEWGIGVVTAAQNITEAGATAQRLTLRFERAGLKTISTAHAALQLAEDAQSAPSAEERPAAAAAGSAGAGWLGELEGGKLAEAMAMLPEATRDPFSSLVARIKATMSLYRFSDQGSTLLDWAAMQTGLADPLSRFSRHELEQFFRRFAMERDNHLKRLMLESRRSNPPELPAAIAEAPKGAREALRRLHIAG